MTPCSGPFAYGATPVLVLFFVAIGASMDVEAIALVGLAALALAGLRFAFVRIGARVGARIAGIDAPAAGALWRALLPTSGITLGFSVLIAADHPDWGGQLQTLVVAAVALYEVVGPILLRAGLAEAGEIGGGAGGLMVVSNREPWMHEYQPDGWSPSVTRRAAWPSRSMR